MIELPALGELDVELWHTLLDIADRMPSDWTLIGGQMVLLHALERGRAPQRVSEDLDLVVDARVRPLALPRMLSTLDELGFAEASISHDEGGPPLLARAHQRRCARTRWRRSAG